MKTLTINVEDWPDRFVEMVQKFADHLDHQIHKNAGPPTPVELPRWPGVALPPEKLRREEIYKDVG